MFLHWLYQNVEPGSLCYAWWIYNWRRPHRHYLFRCWMSLLHPKGTAWGGGGEASDLAHGCERTWGGASDAGGDGVARRTGGVLHITCNGSG